MPLDDACLHGGWTIARCCPFVESRSNPPSSYLDGSRRKGGNTMHKRVHGRSVTVLLQIFDNLTFRLPPWTRLTNVIDCPLAIRANEQVQAQDSERLLLARSRMARRVGGGRRQMAVGLNRRAAEQRMPFSRPNPRDENTRLTHNRRPPR